MFNKLEFTTLFAICFILIMTVISLIPNTLANYAYNYYQFLHPLWLFVPVVLVLSLLLIDDIRKVKYSTKIIPWMICIGLIASFICFRTHIHVFGGDVPERPMLTPKTICISDFIPVEYANGHNQHIPWLEPIVEKLCGKFGLFAYTDATPVIFSTAVHTILIGSIFAILICVFFRNRLDLLSILATAPFIFNFFGNVDSYAVHMLFALILLLQLHKLWNKEILKFIDFIVPGLLLLFGIWQHPLFVILVFPMIILFMTYLKQYKQFKSLNDYILIIIIGIVLIILLSQSSKCNNLFFKTHDNLQPVFSKITFIHYFNSMLLPSLPFFVIAFNTITDKIRLKQLVVVFICESILFLFLGFVLGAVDQFNFCYFVFLVWIPWILEISKNKCIKFKHVLAVISCQLFLLIPMIGVHSTNATIKRALALGPIDICAHKDNISWQTHLGLLLTFNKQPDAELRRAALDVFIDGFKNAKPTGFRPGNGLYYVTSLYEWGYIKLAKQELFNLLEYYPQAINYFITIFPGHIIYNREILWKDVAEFLEKHNSPQLQQYNNIVEQLKIEANKRPYLDHPIKFVSIPGLVEYK